MREATKLSDLLNSMPAGVRAAAINGIIDAYGTSDSCGGFATVNCDDGSVLLVLRTSKGRYKAFGTSSAEADDIINHIINDIELGAA